MDLRCSDCGQRSLPPPLDLSHHFSKTTKKRAVNKVKQFYKYFAIPGIGQLAGGLPNQSYFPYDTLEARVALPDRWKPTPDKAAGPPAKKPTKQPKKDAPVGDAKLLIPKLDNNENPAKRIDVASALQYGTAQGYPPLHQWLTEFTREFLHPNIPYRDGAEITLSLGNTDGFSKVLQAFNNEWHEGDPVSEREGLLCEKYAFGSAVQQAKPRGMNIVPVGIDEEGMLAEGPGGLRDVLENWDYERGQLPRLIYTVTIGQNPTSGVLSVQRRREIYAICSAYDVLICEDDPYWYLQYPGSRDASVNYNTISGGRSSGYPFLDSLVPSYLSLDTDGRVVRLDTFSKTVAPGCRMGWITAQPAFIERILRITEATTQNPSGFVQSMIAELVMGPKGADRQANGGAQDDQGWQFDGWVRWLEGLRGEYRKRMEEMCNILDAGKTVMKSGRRPSLSRLTADLTVQDGESPQEEEWSVIEKTAIYDFIRPAGGMFLWVHFNYHTHPCFDSVTGPRLASALFLYWAKAPYRVLVGPGNNFAPTPEVARESAWQFFRLCFAAEQTELIGDISRRFVAGAKAFWRIKDKEEIEELLKEIEDGEDEAFGDQEVANAMGNVMGFC